MAFASRSADSMLMSQINITPIVGMLLALVAVFAMFGTPKEVRKLPMYFRQTTICDLGVPAPKILQLSIKDTREIYLDGQSLSDGQLASKLRDRVNSSTEAEPLQLLIRTDPKTPYARFAEILALAQRSGVKLQGIQTADLF